MIIKRLSSGFAVADPEFDAMYTPQMQTVSEFYFTPVAVAQMAARYLVDKPGDRVLDIGSGAGKFCMVGAACTQGHFTGVEQRELLYLRSRQLSDQYGLSNTTFLHSNITETDFSAFDAFFLFNPFYEHIDQIDPIDHSVELNRRLYDHYCLFVKKQLEQAPVGTRLATYFSYGDEVPLSFDLQSTGFEGKLKLWKKQT